MDEIKIELKFYGLEELSDSLNQVLVMNMFNNLYKWDNESILVRMFD